MSASDAMAGFKFGCDPELFVIDSNDRFVCPTFVPGTKEEPFKVDHGAVQRDGMAAEFNIEPVSNYRDWTRNITAVMKQLEGFLPPGHRLVAVPTATFDPDVFDNAPDDAKMLGCSPDFNAWTGSVNPPPNDPDNPYLRTASGHLHIGWRDGGHAAELQHIMNCRDLVKQLDWYLGGWSLKLDPDPVRRRLYGNAGACRFKPYGVEYRVLSNFWLVNDNRRMAVWNRMQRAIQDMRSFFVPDLANMFKFNDVLIKSINESSRSLDLERHFSFPLKNLTKKPKTKHKVY